LGTQPFQNNLSVVGQLQSITLNFAPAGKISFVLSRDWIVPAEISELFLLKKCKEKNVKKKSLHFFLYIFQMS